MAQLPRMPELDPVRFRTEVPNWHQAKKIINSVGASKQTRKHSLSVNPAWDDELGLFDERTKVLTNEKSILVNSAVKGIMAAYWRTREWGITTYEMSTVGADLPGLPLAALCVAIAKVAPDASGPYISFTEYGHDINQSTAIGIGGCALQLNSYLSCVGRVQKVVTVSAEGVAHLPKHIAAQAEAVSELTEGEISVNEVYKKLGFDADQLPDMWQNAMLQETPRLAATLIMQQMSD